MKQIRSLLYLDFAILFGALLFVHPMIHAAGDALRPVDQMVLQDYQKIQEALTADTLKPVPTYAKSISRTVKNDREKRLPAALAEQADKLSNDSDLKTARDNFKALSATLVSYLQSIKAKGTGYHENYCPMVKASWLEKGKTISNPYLGKEMLKCGEAKREF